MLWTTTALRRILGTAASCALCTGAFADELHVPGQFSTIQSAVNAAANGDAVVVAPGTYSQAVRLMGKRVTLRSSGGAAVTTLSGATLSGSILAARDGETFETVVQGFTFTNGRGTLGAVAPNCNSTTARAGGAVYIGTGSSVTFSDCRFVHNAFNLDVIAGGAIYVYRGAIRVQACVFEDNGGYISDDSLGVGYGGAIGVCGGSAGGVEVTDSMFVGNYAGFGGGLLPATSGPVLVARCTFIENDGSHGGGICVGGGTAGLLVSDCAFIANSASHGGGLNLDSDAPNVVVRGCTFTDNESSHGGGAVVYTNGGGALIEDCSFTGNQAAFGGGLNLTAVNSSTGPEVVATVRRCTFDDNLAGFGGGLFAMSNRDSLSGPAPVVEINDSTFSANTAGICCNTGIFGSPCWNEGPSFGGGVDFRVQGGIGRVVNGLFTGNTGPRGAALSITTCGEPQWGVYGGGVSAVNCTIAGNSGPAVDLRIGRTGYAHVLNSIVRGTGASQVTTFMKNPVAGQAEIAVRHSNIQGGFAGPGNTDSDPGFIDGAAGDYRLSSGSVAIDAGDSAALPPEINYDLSGAARRMDDTGTPDTGAGGAPVVDMGAYEFQGTSCVADYNGDGFVDGIDSDLFNNDFDAGNMAADVNGDGFVDGIDYDTFNNAFDAGC